MRIRTRLQALERKIRPAKEPLRIVICYTGGPPVGLDKATCKRSRLEDGSLYEVVTVYDRGISDEDMDRFVEKFPIEPYDPMPGLS